MASHREVGQLRVTVLVAGTATPVMGADVARHALEIMLKAHESARAGRVLDLESTFAW